MLPILGAVPDAAVIYFSGRGPIAEAQDDILIGMGTVVGSNVLIMTIPWAAAGFEYIFRKKYFVTFFQSFFSLVLFTSNNHLPHQASFHHTLIRFLVFNSNSLVWAL